MGTINEERGQELQSEAGVTLAKSLLNFRLLENVLVCESPGDYRTLRNTIEAQFLGRASTELLNNILENADKIWESVRGNEERKMELRDLLRNWRAGLEGTPLADDEVLADYICDKLNQEKPVDREGTE